MKRKFVVLHPYLFEPTESFHFDAFFVKLYEHYANFHHQLPMDPRKRLDFFFNMVSVAVIPENVATTAEPAAYHAITAATTFSSPTSAAPASGQDRCGDDLLADGSESSSTAAEARQLDQDEKSQAFGSKTCPEMFATNSVAVLTNAAEVTAAQATAVVDAPVSAVTSASSLYSHVADGEGAAEAGTLHNLKVHA